jgi:hypothetical protein
VVIREVSTAIAKKRNFDYFFGDESPPVMVAGGYMGGAI